MRCRATRWYRLALRARVCLAYFRKRATHWLPLDTEANAPADLRVLRGDAGSRVSLARKADIACGTSCMDRIAFALGGIHTQLSERSSLNPP